VIGIIAQGGLEASQRLRRVSLIERVVGFLDE
jgi:hypothetical protein